MPAKVNGGAKGKRAERELAKILSDRFGQPFSRAVGSGNRWSQVAALPSHALETFSGDLCCPEGFRWSLECKCGYDDIDLGSLQPNKQLDEFLSQAEADGERSGRKPMLLYKRARKPWVAFVKIGEVEAGLHGLIYKGWLGVPLEELLSRPDEFWFGG